METTKICTCCNTEKSTLEFNKNKSKKDGLSTECKSCIKIYKDEYRKNNAEKISIGKKKHYEANKEKIIAKNAEWKNKNREHHNKTSREYNNKNKERVLKRTKEYFNSENGKISKRNTHYKRKLAMKNGISTLEILKHTSNIKNCYWCNCKIDKTIKNGFHLDHYIPLSKGGTHTLENIVISCPSCNILKSNKDPYQFALQKGRLL